MAFLQHSLLRNQKGAISLLGAASIALSLYTFNLVVEFGNAKLLDRQLDNYAKTAAYMALRTELALTVNMSDAEKAEARSQIDLMLNQVGLYLDAEGNNYNLDKYITFGNFDENGQFVALTANASTPRDVADGQAPPDFSAVAVQLVSGDSFLGVFTPQGKALLGLSVDEQNADSGCYCKNRYASCLSAELTEADLSALGVAASDVSVANSQAREKYCRYGWTSAKAPGVTKYPYAEFNNPWIGKPVNSGDSFSFFTTSYSDMDVFNDVLNHKPVEVVDGEDELNKSSSACFCMPSGGRTIYGEDNASVALDYDNSYLDDRSQYRCEDNSCCSSAQACSDASGGSFWSPKEQVFFSDAVYIGYEGTCVSNSGETSVQSCLSYNDSGTTRFESCLDIQRRDSMSLNFFERMLAFFFGPWLDWERSYEGLNCEMQKMQYKGWWFWGGWQEV
ncbi:hypothetical protein QCB44_10020 [Thiomicrorhabdus sp. zzn3]|uniref:hypothetical protein n=1 Tax=Thiomicrorhabdus sp. zzn3 TaxID=3039775 RepID=UPI002436AED0|nr:hypothetical protein [Thiomicrorhabdus sp. zzn3]MDG6779040.1 hypothetical protein [Thiomicrorhabdus sp. zzn3]